MDGSKEDLRASLTKTLGENVQDADEEVFSLFSDTIPSQNLGFVDSTANSVQVGIAGHEYELLQSPGLLNGSRKGGTTGAVLWMVSPAVARWLIRDKNFLWNIGILHKGASVVELGCGITGVIGLCLSPMVGSYILTDQEYVMKRLQANIDANVTISSRKAPPRPKGRLEITSLDWEADSASKLRTYISKDGTIDLVIACDCIYNDFLVQPFVETCVDVCKLSKDGKTLLLIAQQLRSDDVLSQWLNTSLKHFDVWRVPDERLSKEVASGSGFAIHLLLLKDSG